MRNPDTGLRIRVVVRDEGVPREPTRAERRKIEAWLARKARPTIVCLECGKTFATASLSPRCPKCGGVDVEPR